MEYEQVESTKEQKNTRDYIAQFFSKDVHRLIVAGVGATIITGIMFAVFMVSPPSNFPEGHVVTIPEGATLSEVSVLFDDQSVVASPLFFKLFVTLVAGDNDIKAGDYYFEEPLSVSQVASRITHGEYGLEETKVTIPEGSTVVDIAAIVAGKIPDFDSSAFLEQAQKHEGYLFPDTYYFLPNVKPEKVVKEMRETFDLRVADLEDDIASSSRSFEDIVIMASIIEKEAWKEKDRRLISGVLWNRLDIGMPLQVDATFLYINGKNTYELTYDDLEIDSPYNTYKYRGLPPGPISNPSLDSLDAAVDPDDSAYLFYLADRSGNTYYSLDYEEHKRYKAIHID